MALVTVQRSPSASNSPPSSEYGSSIHSLEEETQCNRSLSEYYFAVKGFAVLLPKKECQQGRQRKSTVPPADIQSHLQAILHLLRPGDTLQMVVRLESFHAGRVRYLAVVNTIGRQDTEESCLIGVDFTTALPTIGLVLAVLADTMINLDGDGGFSVSSAGRKHIFKPISVQAMWSALQTVHKESGKAREHRCYQGGLNHDWVGYYDRSVSSDQSCINEWNAMDSLESRRPPSPDSLNNKEETELLIRSKLKEIMMSVDIDEVTSKFIRQRLEEDLKMDLFKFKSFIDQEMMTILGQMDAATEIFPHVYLGSEWNASNLEELKNNGVGFILNVTKEIDNFYPGMFDYLNIRVYDDEKTELLRHWDDTYKYISQVKEKGSKVLVHCKMGISRSASVVIAYAMKAHNLSLEDATKLVKNKRSCIKPNQAFTSQLKIYQGILDASRQRHNALFRSKSETNLKSTNNSSQANTMRFSYAPRGAHVMPIPDFKPRVDPSTEVRGEVEGKVSRSPSPSEALVTTLSVLRVPSPVQGRRPRSWSPDEDTTKMLSLHPYDETEFGELLQKSRSLNDQAWQAHVTVVQRDLRDPGGGCMTTGGFVEAINPIYVPAKSPITNPCAAGQRIEQLHLSSSVKEIINEFESAKGGTQKKGSTGLKKSPPLTITLDNVTTSSSSDFNTNEEAIVDPLTNPQPDSKDESVVTSSSKPHSFHVKPQTVIVMSSQPCKEKASVAEENLPDVNVCLSNEGEPPKTTSSDSVGAWPTGLVRKQKEDFEVKGKLLKEEKVRGKEHDGILSRQGSSHSLNAVELSKGTNLDGSEASRKEDPFSLKVDRVFDREEKKDKKTCVINDKRESPSRNNSWGSFDSAVVLPDRDTPSRQSSWGSCDTRFSGGSLLSRNSSFGAFDNKTTSGTPFVAEGALASQTNYIAYCVDKDASNNRRSKINVKVPNVGFFEEEDPILSRGVTNVKAYVPLPFKSQSESEESNLNFLPVVQNGLVPNANPLPRDDTDLEELVPPYKFQPDSNSYSHRAGVKRGLKTSPQTPEHEIPLPGTVKQQMQKLESKTKQVLRETQVCDVEGNLSVPGIGRSFSSGCVCTSNVKDRNGQITRSSSEKRAKTDLESSKGSVKKITKALEVQNSGKHSYSLNSSRSFKQKGKRDRTDLMPRSQSLERLGVGAPSSSPPTPNKRLSAYCPRNELTSSQNFLDQLVVETQAQVQQLEKDQEEINVKNLVGLFEDAKSDVNKQQRLGPVVQDLHSVDDEPSTESFMRRKIRPRSESMGEQDCPHLPPVPQRKSSLDFSFKSFHKNSTNGQQALSSTNAKHHPNSGPSNGPGNQKGVHLSPPKPPPPPPPPPPTSTTTQNNRGCGSEVRRRKQQQGKTHPLSKLTPREKTL